jgi:protein-S-isoprenylcysteine O-methyltransferase Ste14
VQTLPDFKIGLLNGWLPLMLYVVGFLLALLPFSRRARTKLFQDPKYDMSVSIRFVRFVGQAGVLAYIGMMLFTPLTSDVPTFLVGAFIYTAGYGTVIIGLHYFKRTPVDQTVVAGPYRVSRNPQWVGLVLVLIGAAAMTGVWLHVGILLAVVIIYHVQILAEEQACLEQFGPGFQAYMDKVPRYFWFL